MMRLFGLMTLRGLSPLGVVVISIMKGRVVLSFVPRPFESQAPRKWRPPKWTFVKLEVLGGQVGVPYA